MVLLAVAEPKPVEEAAVAAIVTVAVVAAVEVAEEAAEEAVGEVEQEAVAKVEVDCYSHRIFHLELELVRSLVVDVAALDAGPHHLNYLPRQSPVIVVPDIATNK